MILQLGRKIIRVFPLGPDIEVRKSYSISLALSPSSYVSKREPNITSTTKREFSFLNNNECILPNFFLVDKAYQWACKLRNQSHIGRYVKYDTLYYTDL